MEEKEKADKRLSKDEEFKIDQRIRISVLAGAVLLLIYLIISAVRKTEPGTAYYVIVMAFVAYYWIMSDIVALKIKHGFEGRTELQKKSYKTMAFFDLVGCIGLGLFLTSGLGPDPGQGGNNRSIIGAVLYLVSMLTGRRLRQEYEKEPGKKEEGSEAGAPETGKKPEEGKVDVSGLPTAADRQKRQLSAAKKIAVLNQQAQDAAGTKDDEDGE